MYILLFLSVVFGGNNNLQSADYELFTDSIPNYVVINDTISVDTITNDTLYKIVEEMPIFSGCEEIENRKEKASCSQQKMFLYMLREIPKTVNLEEKKAAEIVVTFIIDKNGIVRNPKILKSIHPDFDTEFLKMVEQMPKWIPGKQNGRNVNVEFKLPIKFNF
jgi:TonB family protein